MRRVAWILMFSMRLILLSIIPPAKARSATLSGNQAATYALALTSSTSEATKLARTGFFPASQSS